MSYISNNFCSATVVVVHIIKILTFLHSSEAYSSNYGLNGVQLKFTAYHSLPFTILKQDKYGNYTTAGINNNMYEWVSRKVNFTIKIVNAVVDPIEIAKIGIYEAAFQRIVNKEVDGILGIHAVNPDRARRMDFTSMMAWSDPYTIVAPKPGPQSRLFAFIRPFQPTVWLFMAICTVVIILMMSGFSFVFGGMHFLPNINEDDEEKADNRNRKKLHKHKLTRFEIIVNVISYYVVFVINILTNHGMYTPFSQNSFRLLATSWLLAALVLVNSYSSIVVSSLTVPVMNAPVNTLEDLANSQEISVVIQPTVVLGQLMMTASSGTLKKLADQARENPTEQLQSDYKGVYKMLETGRYGYAFIKSINRDFVVQQYKKDKKCRLQISPPLQLSSAYFMFMLQKNSPYTKYISNGLVNLWETGLSTYWVEKDIPNAYSCVEISNSKLAKASIRPIVGIKLEDLTSAFLIFGIGIGLGFFVFLVEWIVGSVKQKH